MSDIYKTINAEEKVAKLTGHVWDDDKPFSYNCIPIINYIEKRQYEIDEMKELYNILKPKTILLKD